MTEITTEKEISSTDEKYIINSAETLEKYSNLAIWTQVYGVVILLMIVITIISFFLLREINAKIIISSSLFIIWALISFSLIFQFNRSVKKLKRTKKQKDFINAQRWLINSLKSVIFFMITYPITEYFTPQIAEDIYHSVKWWIIGLHLG